MNRAFSPSLVRPNLPLRRPATGPGAASPRMFSPPPFNGSCPTQERPLANGNGDAYKGEASRMENGSLPAKDSATKMGSMPTAPVILKLCNYCGQQGNLRCTRCKKTCYCSVACQTEDWKAHRHICKPSAPEISPSDKSKEVPASPLVNGPSVLDSKVTCSDAAQPKRVYLRDLLKTDLPKGAKVQASVVEVKNPGKFFIHVQTVETMESLRNITVELQKTYSGSHATEYEPETGEICGVRFSLDQNWYRGLVQAVGADGQTASILYIDFGNEEEATLDRIKPLAANIDPLPPCALQCRVAGVMAATSSWTDECSIVVRQLVAGKSLTITVVDTVEKDTVLSVDVLLTTIGKNLSSFLVDQGYAVKESSTPTKPRTEQEIDSIKTASFENFKRLSGGKNENTDAQPPEPLTQGVGDAFSAVVTHLQSPSEIICQKLDNASVIQELQVSLREFCSQSQASENFRPAPGTVCCSLFSEDNQWYRAKVLAYSSEARVCVGYIDFGNSEEVDLSCLRPIGVDLLALATQAIPCCLAGVRPAAEAWSEEATQVMRHLVCNRFLRVEILGQRDGMALVALIDESSDPQTNIAELLVATGYALAESSRTEVAEAAQGAVAEATVVSPGAEKLEWSCAELPCNGQEVALVVSVLENPGEFYCYHYNAEDLQVLAELSVELMKHCESDSSAFSPAVGEPCCALFTGDGSWYRGMVQGVWGEGRARVYFVDYGNSSEVEACHLRAISPRLLKHPFQAIRCWLTGVEPVGGQWSKEAVLRFQALCVGQQLIGRVLSITERGYGVELQGSGHNIATALISEQLAWAAGHEKSLAATPPAAAVNQTEPSPTTQQPAANQREVPAEQPAKATAPLSEPHPTPQSSGSFPLDWRTVELPNKTFHPRVAALINPSLFYVMNTAEVNAEGLRAVMLDVEKHCSRQTAPNQCVPLPGAACCAQFSGDKNWYRAVVLETTDTSVSVIYADYGNMENVPFSSILPIPKDLLLPPFQIVRCALADKEQFPAVWPPEVLELFGAQLSSSVLASVQAFNGNSNLLSMTQPSGQGGHHINSLILNTLENLGKAQAPGPPGKAQAQGPPGKAQAPGPPGKAQAQGPPGKAQAQGPPGKAQAQGPPGKAQAEAPAPEQRRLQAQGAVKATAQTSAADREQPRPQAGPETDHVKMTTTITESKQEVNPQNSTKGSSAPLSSCCCVDLKDKIDQIEELILLLMKQMTK